MESSTGKGEVKKAERASSKRRCQLRALGRSSRQKCRFLAFDCTSDAIGVCIANVGNDLSAQRRAYDAIAALIMIAVNAEAPRAS
jgi:hypothetical protein